MYIKLQLTTHMYTVVYLTNHLQNSKYIMCTLVHGCSSKCVSEQDENSVNQIFLMFLTSNYTCTLCMSFPCFLLLILDNSPHLILGYIYTHVWFSALQLHLQVSQTTVNENSSVQYPPLRRLWGCLLLTELQTLSSQAFWPGNGG